MYSMKTYRLEINLRILATQRLCNIVYHSSTFLDNKEKSLFTVCLKLDYRFLVCLCNNTLVS